MALTLFVRPWCQCKFTRQCQSQDRCHSEAWEASCYPFLPLFWLYYRKSAFLPGVLMSWPFSFLASCRISLTTWRSIRSGASNTWRSTPNSSRSGQRSNSTMQNKSGERLNVACRLEFTPSAAALDPSEVSLKEDMESPSHKQQSLTFDFPLEGRLKLEFSF